MKKTMMVLALLALAGTTQAACYSEGMRVGEVQKFSAKGYLNKSWEGELVQGGVRSKQKGTVTNIWKFSVTDPAVAKKVDDAAFAGGEVAVRYCQLMPLAHVGTSDTSYIVTDARAR